jgi:hypothetical protein
MKNDYVLSKVKEAMSANPMRPLEVIQKVLFLDPGVKEWQVIDALSYLLQTDGMRMTMDRKYQLV